MKKSPTMIEIYLITVLVGGLEFSVGVCSHTQTAVRKNFRIGDYTRWWVNVCIRASRRTPRVNFLTPLFPTASLYTRNNHHHSLSRLVSLSSINTWKKNFKLFSTISESLTVSFESPFILYWHLSLFPLLQFKNSVFVKKIVWMSLQESLPYEKLVEVGFVKETF